MAICGRHPYGRLGAQIERVTRVPRRQRAGEVAHGEEAAGRAGYLPPRRGLDRLSDRGAAFRRLLGRALDHRRQEAPLQPLARRRIRLALVLLAHRPGGLRVGELEGLPRAARRLLGRPLEGREHLRRRAWFGLGLGFGFGFGLGLGSGLGLGLGLGLGFWFWLWFGFGLGIGLGLGLGFGFSADEPFLRARSSGVSSPRSSLATTASGYAFASASTTAGGALPSTA